MRWFKRSSADTPHLKSLSPLNNNELQQGSLHPVVVASGVANTTAANVAATIKSGEVGSRNEFLSVAMLNATVGIEEEQQRQRQYADAVKRYDSDRYSHSKENRRDWRRSYNRSTINCYNIQEGKIVNTVKIRDRSLSPNFLRRKRSDVMDVRKIFETTKAKESNEFNNQSYNVNTVRIRCRNNLVKERRNPLPTTRLSFCESKLAFEDTTNYSNYENPAQPYDVNSLNSRINEMLSISTPRQSRYYNNQNHMYHNENYSTKACNDSLLANKSKSVEDFSKDDLLSLNRLIKPENKFKTLSGKTQKFLSNFYRTHFDKSSMTPKQQSTQNLHHQHQQNNHQNSSNHGYESNNRFITDPTVGEDEWCMPNDYRLSESCYSTLIDSHFMASTTDADSGILENDSGQSSLNSIPVGENVSTDAGIRLTDAASNTINHHSNGESRGGTLSNSDFLVTILCDDNFHDFGKHLYHSKGSYFITNLIAKKIKLIDGFILAGDEILDICGIPVRGKPYIEIYNLLQNIQLNSQNNYVRLLVRRISEIGNGSASSGIANTYQKGVVNSRRSGICLLRDVEKLSDKSLDYAANAIRIDGSRTKLKPPTETNTSSKKTNLSGYGSITRRLIRRSVLGKLTSSSVIDVSQASSETATANDDNNRLNTSSNSDNESASTEIEQHNPVPSNFYTLPRKSKIGVYSFHTICYEKGPGKKSLGFTIVGGRDSPKGAIGIFVKRILNTGQAIDDGRLRVGDEILSVNGQVCHDLSHEEAVKLFKSIRNGEIVLRVCRREKQRAAEAKNNELECKDNCINNV